MCRSELACLSWSLTLSLSGWLLKPGIKNLRGIGDSDSSGIPKLARSGRNWGTFCNIT